jgi:acetate kinase
MTNRPSANPNQARVLTINGGPSSIKFALFEVGDSLQRLLESGVDRIRLPEATTSAGSRFPSFTRATNTQ